MRTDVKIGFVVGLCLVVGWLGWLLLSSNGDDPIQTDDDRNTANFNDNGSDSSNPALGSGSDGTSTLGGSGADDSDADSIFGTGDPVEPDDADTAGPDVAAGGADTADAADADDDDEVVIAMGPGRTTLGGTTLDGSDDGGRRSSAGTGNGGGSTLGGSDADTEDDDELDIPDFLRRGSEGGTTLGGTDADRTDTSPTLGGTDISGGSAITYEVRPGETLSELSKRFYGSTRYWNKILQANPGATEMIRPGQRLKIPPRSEVVASSGSATALGGSDSGSDLVVPSGWKTHKIDSGDTLGEISTKFYGTSRYWQKIRDANPDVNPNALQVGDVLRIPPRPAEEATASARPAGPSEAPITVPAGWKVHVVASGDMLGDISKKFYGTTRYWPLIQEKNPGINPNNLQVGQQLRIPPPPAGGTMVPVPSGTASGDSTGSDDFPIPDMSGLDL
ncbi:MAG: LysM peptidoglycan-binding domain-containing protein [Planctomycetota bacterium]